VDQKAKGALVDADAHAEGVGGRRVVGGVGHGIARSAGDIRRSVWV
jgi:hypothetical protein